MTERPGGFAPGPSLPAPSLPPRGTPPAGEPTVPTQRYHRVGVLGQGGMGRVWLAWDEVLRRNVAIKEPHGGAASREAATLRHEAMMAARLEHPGIVVVHDVVEGDPPWFVMACVRGERLGACFAGAPRTRLVRYVLEASEAVGHAHAQGVVHRDLSPSNILVGEDGKARVIDWGVSAETGASRVAGRAVGTPGFIPPEVDDAGAADPRADVWSLGAILRCACAGAPATDGQLPSLPGDVEPALRAVVERAMAPTPDDRYDDAAALADDLQRWFDGRRVRAYEMSTWQLAGRVLRAWRWRLVAAAVAALAVGAALAYGQQRAAREARRAQAAEQSARTAALEAGEQASRARSALALNHARRASEAERSRDFTGARQALRDSLALEPVPLAVGVDALLRQQAEPVHESSHALPDCPQWVGGAGSAVWYCRDGHHLAAWRDGTWLWRHFVRNADTRVRPDAIDVLTGRRQFVRIEATTGRLLEKDERSGQFLNRDGTLRVSIDQVEVYDFELPRDACAGGGTIAIEPAGEGAWLLACRYGGVRLWNARSRTLGPLRFETEVFDVLYVADGETPSVPDAATPSVADAATLGGWGATRSGELLALDGSSAGIALGEPAYALIPMQDPALLLVRGALGSLRVVHLERRETWATLPSSRGTVFVDGDGAIVVADRDRVDRWRVATTAPISLYRVNRGVTSLAWSPDSATLFAADGGGVVHRMDRERGAVATAHPVGWRMIKDIRVRPDVPDRLAVISSTHIDVHVVDTGNLDAPASRIEALGPGRRVAILDDGTAIAPTYAPHVLRRRDGQAIETLLAGVDVYDLEVDPAHRFVVVAAPDGIWRLRSSGPPERLADGYDDVRAVAVDRAGAIAIARRSEVRFLGDEGAAWTEEGSITDLALSPDGLWLVTGTLDGWVRIYETRTGRLVAEHHTHRERVSRLVVSPDGRWLASASWDGTVRIADLHAVVEAVEASGAP